MIVLLFKSWLDRFQSQKHNNKITLFNNSTSISSKFKGNNSFNGMRWIVYRNILYLIYNHLYNIQFQLSKTLLYSLIKKIISQKPTMTKYLTLILNKIKKLITSQRGVYFFCLCSFLFIKHVSLSKRLVFCDVIL